MENNQEYQNAIEQKSLDLVRKNITRQNCFSISDKKYTELLKWLEVAKPNPNSNEFPDFLFENGL